MDGIYFAAPPSYSEILVARMPGKRQILQEEARFRAAIEIAPGMPTAWLSEDPSVGEEIEAEELRVVHEHVVSPVFYVLLCSDLLIVTQLAVAMLDDPRVVVGNTSGLVVPGHEFAEIIRFRPNWDWRDTPAVPRPDGR